MPASIRSGPILPVSMRSLSTEAATAIGSAITGALVPTLKTSATGSGAIATSVLVPAGKVYRVTAVTLHLDAAPTTSEAFTITINAQAGAAYDTLAYSIDLSAGSVTDVLWQPDEFLYLIAGDALDVAYTNTDADTFGLQVTVREVTS